MEMEKAPADASFCYRSTHSFGCRDPAPAAPSAIAPSEVPAAPLPCLLSHGLTRRLTGRGNDRSPPFSFPCEPENLGPKVLDARASRALGPTPRHEHLTCHMPSR